MFRSMIQVAGSLLLSTALVLMLLWLLDVAPVAIVRAQGTIRYVAPGGSDSSGCTTAPCATVQHAVDQAQSGDEIRVATGVYTGVQGRVGITQVVYISKTVTVRGGYSQDFTAWNPAVFKTTLDAQEEGRVLVITRAITAVVEGLCLTGGNATGLGGTPYNEDVGGGVYIYTATATISGCIVFSNTACTTWAAASQCQGGGLYLVESTATLQNNIVISNTACAARKADRGKGGGLYLKSSDATLLTNTVQGNLASTFPDGEGGGLYLVESAATLRDSIVQSNTASVFRDGHGGGLYLWSSEAMLEGNRVQGNIASTGGQGSGGGLHLDSSAATFLTNTVRGNTASITFQGDGGGLYLALSDAALYDNTVEANTASAVSYGQGGGLSLVFSGATLEGNNVQGNVASTANSGNGGGLCLLASAFTLDGNMIISNTATLSQTAVGRGGGLYVSENSSFTLTNNLIADNHANTGGSALWFIGWEFYPTFGRLLHTTIVDNGSTGRPIDAPNDNYGEGVHVDQYTTLFFTNTIIAGYSRVGITVTAGSTATLDGTLWYDNGMGIGGRGTVLTGTVNVDGDPAFVNPTAWDYHLSDSSAAIDTGVDTGVSIDIDGAPRPQGAGYDIGADEFMAAEMVTYTLTIHTVGQGIVTREPPGTALLPASAIFEAGTRVTLTARPEGDWTFDRWSGHLKGRDNPASIIMDADKVVTATFSHSVTNQVPTANASATPTFIHNGTVVLDGSGSRDPEGDPLSYDWAQTDGTPVALNDTATVSVTFNAPSAAGVLTFTLTVTDSYNMQDTDSVTVTVINEAPTAEAVAVPATLHSGIVVLDGSGSRDPEGDPLTYDWAQTDGTPVALSDTATVSVTFNAPSAAGVLTFTLTVTDSFDVSDRAIITVTVERPRIYLPTVLRND